MWPAGDDEAFSHPEMLDILLGPEEPGMMQEADSLFDSYLQHFGANQPLEAEGAQPGPMSVDPFFADLSAAMPVCETAFLDAAVGSGPGSSVQPSGFSNGACPVPFLSNAGSMKLDAWSSRDSLPVGSLGGASELGASSSGNSIGPTGVRQPEPLQHQKSTSSRARNAPSMTDEKLAAVKEKNKKAQKKFRDKQKAKFQESESRLVEFGARIAQLEEENKKLESRNVILERLLSMKLDDAGTPGLLVSGGGVQASMQVCGRALLSSCQPKQAIVPFNNPVGTAPKLKSVTLRLHGRETVLSAEQLTRLCWAELARIYKDYVNEMAGCLVAGEDSSRFTERLPAAVKELFTLCSGMACYNPKLFRTFFHQKMEDTSFAEPEPTQAMWASITRSLALGPEQREVVLRLRQEYLGTLAHLLDARQGLKAAIASPASTLADQRSVSAEYVEALDAAEALSRNLREDHQNFIEFVAPLWGRVFTPVQVATAVVQAYPWVADPLALVNVVAAELGVPNADAVMREALQSSSPTSAGATTAPPA